MDGGHSRGRRLRAEEGFLAASILDALRAQKMRRKIENVLDPIRFLVLCSLSLSTNLGFLGVRYNEISS